MEMKRPAADGSYSGVPALLAVTLTAAGTGSPLPPAAFAAGASFPAVFVGVALG